MSTIKPTIGRKVYFYDPSTSTARQQDMQRYSDSQPFDATVVYVWGDTCVNLRITDHAGNTHVRTSVPLRDPADGDAHGKEYVATWMPFQVGQAKVQVPPAVAPAA
jgi:hypothetical protein